jgi:hypothetical protein
MMARQMRLMIAAATLSAACAVGAAQTADQPGPVNSTVQQQQPAPIERGYPSQNRYAGPQMPPVTQATIAPGQDLASTSGEAEATPIEGVTLRVGPQSSVKDVSSDAQKLELHVERGVANIDVHDPAKDTLILVDLPGGQTQLLKNGLYTFNAETNTARVLRGEALAFPSGDAANAKPIKVKEYNKIVYSGKNVRPREFTPYELRADLLPGPRVAPGYGGGGTGPSFGYGPYGDGFYPYYAPYYAYGYPWGWGYPFYPYGYGFYPFGVGLGFGYYGGFYGGYGFHGYGFHGRR